MAKRRKAQTDDKDLDTMLADLLTDTDATSVGVTMPTTNEIKNMIRSKHWECYHNEERSYSTDNPLDKYNGMIYDIIMKTKPKSMKRMEKRIVKFIKLVERVSHNFEKQGLSKERAIVETVEYIERVNPGKYTHLTSSLTTHMVADILTDTQKNNKIPTIADSVTRNNYNAKEVTFHWKRTSPL